MEKQIQCWKSEALKGLELKRTPYWSWSVIASLVPNSRLVCSSATWRENSSFCSVPLLWLNLNLHHATNFPQLDAVNVGCRSAPQRLGTRLLEWQASTMWHVSFAQEMFLLQNDFDINRKSLRTQFTQQWSANYFGGPNGYILSTCSKECVQLACFVSTFTDSTWKATSVYKK